MNTIHVLNTYDPNKTEQCIQIKIEHNITLLNLFPSVLEHIICEYVHDIIEVKLIRKNKLTLTTEIHKQSVNCNLITWTWHHYVPYNKSFDMKVLIDNLKRIFKN